MDTDVYAKGHGSCGKGGCRTVTGARTGWGALLVGTDVPERVGVWRSTETEWGECGGPGEPGP